jgi:hypothetical protein
MNLTVVFVLGKALLLATVWVIRVKAKYRRLSLVISQWHA